jgi:hypothetical protein
MKTGELDRAINRLKAGQWGWGYIFARVVLGFLYDSDGITSAIDAIIPTPAYLPEGTPVKGNDHARWVIEQAAEQDERGLPFITDPPLIVTRIPVPKMRHTSSLAERRMVARKLYSALNVPDPTRVAGRHIMVYDDVFTGGHTLNAVAKRLREAGALGVYGLTLGRQPWTSRS